MGFDGRHECIICYINGDCYRRGEMKDVCFECLENLAQGTNYGSRAESSFRNYYSVVLHTCCRKCGLDKNLLMNVNICDTHLEDFD